MENASKGLMIAGSILLTIMVVGMLVYFLSQYRQFPQAQAEAQRAAQVTKFNREYESYDKKKMYGTDVATIVNKAINNNKKYADQRTGQYIIDEENNHYINVEITLLTDIQRYARQYYEVQQPDEETKSYVANEVYTEGVIRGYINGDRTREVVYNLDEEIFPAGKTISLIEEHGNLMIPNKTIEDFFTDDATVRIQLTSGGAAEADKSKFDSRNYTEVYSGFTDFKRSYFKCTSIHYDEETSMIDEITFEEIKELHTEDKEE